MPAASIRSRCLYFQITFLCRSTSRRQRWLSISQRLGWHELVRDGDRPAPVPHHVIEALKGREDARGLIQLKRAPRFSPGDPIRVVNGALYDCLGLYEGMSGDARVAICLIFSAGRFA